MQRFAEEAGIPYASISPSSLSEDLDEWVANSSPDLVLVQTFPHLIPAESLGKPPFGYYNLHPSPLPSYRGPDPIFWQVAQNEKQSGITLHQMSTSFDTGPVLHVESIPIEATDTYGIVQTNLSYAAINALKEFIHTALPSPKAQPQEEAASSSQGKPQTQDLVIDWANMGAADIAALVRACNPHQNGAITFFRDVMTRVLEVSIQDLDRVPKLPAGSVVAADAERGLQVLCADDRALSLGILHVEEGYYSGNRFCEVFAVGLGEKFCTPSFLS
ncbi:MAG: formyltransferase family protein [Bacteroidota bacterium]